MRDLNTTEVHLVAGGNNQCTPENSYGGVTDTDSVGQDLIDIYEGVVAAASHIIERVAGAL